MGVLVAVGERRYDRRLAIEEVSELRSSWDADPVGNMLRGIPARYATPARLWVDLLPPDRRIGTWEATLARRNAFRLATEWPEGGPRFLLLGRRVAAAFGAGDYDFGSVLFAWDCPAIVLPHPSGRSRWWNAEGREELVEWWVEVFSRCFCAG